MTDTYTPLPEADFSIPGKIRNLSRRSLGDLIYLQPPRKGKAPSHKGLLLSHLPIVLVGAQGHTELLTHGMLLRQLIGSSLENFRSLKVFEVERESLTHEELEVLRYLSEVLPQELFNTTHVMEARTFIKQLNEKPGLEEKLARIVFGLSKPTLDIKSLMILTQGRWAKSTLQRAHSPKGQQSLDDDRGASEPLSLETSKDNEAQKAAPTSVPLTPQAPKPTPPTRWQAASGTAKDTTRPAPPRTRQSHVLKTTGDLFGNPWDESESPSS
ncbi:MAG: hypothetical protein CL810_14945 [Cobetia sp.]|jgi:hypothetical protein|uniref:hypothetical protein n=1 Tax=Cobetia sp. TaxID=1873876 RepID=UPI000C3F1BF9|nr:hypothetical protein [Cobetia sp.]MBF10418.1 hypothetical protein [Cobetia sp.]MBK10826.1 hypothetical protein [Cobetia sp.]HBJ27227.1 hypothetical protein [Cobetia sp.]|tara:strand:- start:5167 stop:5976 length:810 start_codon:yes stop_codon:yes gene_type:complete